MTSIRAASSILFVITALACSGSSRSQGPAPSPTPPESALAGEPWDGLELPTVTRAGEPGLMVSLVASRSAVFVDGERVLGLTDGRAEASDRRGMLISPLFDRLRDKADQAKEFAARAGMAGRFEGRVAVSADRRLPAETLAELMYTAGQAEFGGFRFLGRTADGRMGYVVSELPTLGPPPRGDAPPPPATAELRLADGAWRVTYHPVERAEASIPCGGCADLGAQSAELRAALELPHPSRAIVVLEGLSVGAAVGLMDVAGAAGVDQVVVTARPGVRPPEPAEPRDVSSILEALSAPTPSE